MNFHGISIRYMRISKLGYLMVSAAECITLVNRRQLKIFYHRLFNEGKPRITPVDSSVIATTVTAFFLFRSFFDLMQAAVACYSPNTTHTVDNCNDSFDTGKVQNAYQVLPP